ncbi:MAG: histidine--tRNA ligase [Anaerolineaceae bacterium]|nr:histidine--tRNA ligase [Anaerolineaceae bacterium]
MKKIIDTVKGTRDFYPQDMALRNWLYENIKSVSESFGYAEWDGPFLERLELYAAKSGEELVKEQSFVFTDRGGDEVALRPELTPSLARMVANRQRELIYPLRWWAFSPFWRYERPQKGRTREFFQWNIDVLGENNIETDTELISVAILFLKRIGLNSDQVKIFVNNRRLMDEQLNKIGVTAGQKSSVFRLIDRRDKMRDEDWKKHAFDLGINEDVFDGINELLNNPMLFKESEELVEMFSILETLGLADYVSFDAKVIRGLDYYTGIVFEARKADNSGRAILGGGHYDNLVGDVGGEPLPGVGFAMGDVMIRVALEEFGLLPEFTLSPAEVLVTIFDENSVIRSKQLGQKLRDAGIKVVNVPTFSKLQKQMKYANRYQIPLVCIEGPSEIETGTVILKNLQSGEQQPVNRERLIETILNFLAEQKAM